MRRQQQTALLCYCIAAFIVVVVASGDIWVQRGDKCFLSLFQTRLCQTQLSSLENLWYFNWSCDDISLDLAWKRAVVFNLILIIPCNCLNLNCQNLNLSCFRFQLVSILQFFTKSHYYLISTHFWLIRSKIKPNLNRFSSQSFIVISIVRPNYRKFTLLR